MTKAKSRYMQQADAAFSKLVKWRDGHTCQRCEKGDYPQCAHLVSRSYKSIRTELTNAVTLCRGCHVYFTHHPLEWEAWCNERWPGRLVSLKAQALGYTRVDWKAERDRLVALLKETDA